MFSLEVIGNLTRDPETGTTDSGVNWCRFTVAVKRKHPKEGENETEFVKVTAWRALGDTCAKYLAKGRKVYVRVDDPRIHTWTGRDGSEKAEFDLTAKDVEFLSSAGGSRNEPTDADAPPERDAETGMEKVDPEDQPF